MDGRPFSIDGRLSRRAFWRAYLRINLFGSAVWVIALGAMLLIGPLGAVLLILLIPALWALVGINLRRAHDRGHGLGWWLLVTFGPFVGSTVSEPLPSTQVFPAMVAFTLTLAGLGLSVWGWIEVGFRRGTRGTNSFGPPRG